MKDLCGREINYMRISITDRCNLRCQYCMPDGIELCPMKDILTYEEIVSVCQEAVSLGIHKFKITGGEPLVRRGCADLIRMIYEIPGTEEVTLTTNGVLLEKYLPELWNAGLRSVNISLDTLDQKVYTEITGFPMLDQVLQSLNAAMKMGMHVKTNTILQRGRNESSWKELLILAKDIPVDVRFLELMPIGEGKEGETISNTTLFQKIKEIYPDIKPDERKHGNGPAIYYKIPGFEGSIGFISAIHGVFCDSCNRLRMTSTGELKPCLCYDETISVRDVARCGDSEKIRENIKHAIQIKPKKHCFSEIEKVSEKKKMAQVAVDKSKFNLVISPEAKIDRQTGSGELMIKNPSENGYPINVEIREKKNNQLVYTSGAIQPGYEIKNVTLEQALEKGEYPSVALFSLYDPDTNEKKGQVAAGVTLTVE